MDVESGEGGLDPEDLLGLGSAVAEDQVLMNHVVYVQIMGSFS